MGDSEADQRRYGALDDLAILPRLALSVRQPWAWAIFNGKDIENRDWRNPNPGLKFRGRAAIHASSGMTRSEYEEAAGFIRSIIGHCPPAHELVRGAILGAVTVTDIVRKSDSPWFFGPCGLVLTDATPCQPVPAKGALGFFQWQENQAALQAPAKWMLPVDRSAAVEPQRNLF